MWILCKITGKVTNTRQGHLHPSWAVFVLFISFWSVVELIWRLESSSSSQDTSVGSLLDWTWRDWGFWRVHGSKATSAVVSAGCSCGAVGRGPWG